MGRFEGVAGDLLYSHIMVAPGRVGGRQGGVIVLGRLSSAFSPQGNNWKGGRCDTCFPVGLELGEASVVPATAPSISVSRFKPLASVNRLIRWQLLRSLKADKITGIRSAIRSTLPLLPSLNYLELSFSCPNPGNRVLLGGDFGVEVSEGRGGLGEVSYMN